MTAVFSPIPKFIFTVLEPLSLIGGFVAPFIDPAYFVNEQIPASKAHPLTPNAHVVALQLGNVYFLLFMLGVGVLYSTTEPKVVRNYIIALWLADFSHMGVTGYFMGLDALLDFRSWNAMTWGNIGATMFLCMARTAWLLGLFAPDHGPRLRRSLPNQRKTR